MNRVIITPNMPASYMAAAAGSALPKLSASSAPEAKAFHSMEFFEEFKINIPVAPAALSPAASIADLPPVPTPAAVQPVKSDSYTEKLIKYIPFEVIGFYLSVDAIIKASQSPNVDIYRYSMFAIGLIGTLLYLRRNGGVKSVVHLTISCFAFAVWAICLGSVFPDTDPLLKGLLLPIFTFLVPLVDPYPKK